MTIVAITDMVMRTAL